MFPEVDLNSIITISNVGELIDYLCLFSPETKVCGIGGGKITIIQQKEEPGRLWFE